MKNKTLNSPIKLAIAIPVYNQAATIAEAIQSTLDQSTKIDEVIVSDNWSTDGTYEIIQGFRDKVKVVKPPAHVSMAENWNFAVSCASADWVGMCSGDDALLSNYSETVKAAIAKEPESVFLMGGWINFSTNRKKVSNHYLLSVPATLSGKEAVKKLLEGPKASFAVYCFKKSAFCEAGGFNEKFKLICDWILQIELAQLGKILCVNKLLARYRVDERPALNQSRQKQWVLDELNYLEKYIWAVAKNVNLEDAIVVSIGRKRIRVLFERLMNCDANFKYEIAGRLRSVAARYDRMQECNRVLSGSWRLPVHATLANLIRAKIHLIAGLCK